VVLIVGVVGAIREGDTLPRTAPLRQHPQVGGNRLSLAIRTSGPSTSVSGRSPHRLGSGVDSARRRAVALSIIDQTFTRRLTKLLLGGFALVGLIWRR
jgi:hypothetical protein